MIVVNTTQISIFDISETSRLTLNVDFHVFTVKNRTTKRVSEIRKNPA